MTDTLERARALFQQVSALLQERGLDAVLIGGLAVNFWSEPRFTTDVDLTVAAKGDRIRAVLQALRDVGFEVERLQDPGQGSGPDFMRLKQPETGVALDFQVAKTEFEDGVLARSFRTPGQHVAVATPEDLLVMKLIANRRKDIPDLDVLGKRPGIDWDYVEHWANVWDAGDRYRELRASLVREEERIRALYAGIPQDRSTSEA